jgi:hypothetical protein
MTTGSTPKVAQGFDGYELQSPAGDACLISRRNAGAGGVHDVMVGQGCSAVYPALGSIRYWREELDGSISLAGSDQAPIVTFAVADGPGYESFRPQLPLLSLSQVR